MLASMVTACGGTPSQGGQKNTDDFASKLLLSAAKATESVVSAVSADLGVAEAKPNPPSPVTEMEAPPVRRSRPAAKAPVQAAPESAPVAVAADASVARQPSEPVEIPESPALDLVDLAEPVGPHLEDSTVYSSADTDVVPPKPPIASGLRPWRSDVALPGPMVEATIASDGTVEKVRVIGTTRMSDAQVLSHVKSWTFEPALRAGEPVRYRVLLDDPITAP